MSEVIDRGISRLLNAVAAGRGLWIELELGADTAAILLSRLDGAGPAYTATSHNTDPLHVTLEYLGKGLSWARVMAAVTATERLSATCGAFRGRVGGEARFRGGDRDGDPHVLLINSIYLRRMRDLLIETLGRLDVRGGSTFDYTPHVTLGRVARDADLTLQACAMTPLHFSSVAICAGDDRISFPLIGPVPEHAVVRADP